MFKEFKGKINDEQEFFVRDRNNLEDYIFEVNSPFLRKESAAQFDLLDMILVVGDANLRPWSPTAEQLIILLRMCMRTQKMLFACSFGFQGLIFLSASNFEKPYKVINGYQNGSQISDLLKSNIDPTTLSVHDIFIDNVTGDILVYNFESGTWIPKGNAGLHYNKAAQEYKTIGKYILKAPTYQDKTKDDESIYLNSNTETICKIKKKFISHWAFKNIGYSFKVPSKNQWDAHPFSCVNPQKQFSVLAESQRGPQIIESYQMFAIQFVLSEKYPETIDITRNYLAHYIELYQSQKQIFKSIEGCINQANEEDNPYFQSRKKQKKIIMQREIKYSSLNSRQQIPAKTSIEIEKESQQFKHVGYSANSQHNYNLYVDNNAIQSQKIVVPQKTNQNNQKNKSVDFNTSQQSNILALDEIKENSNFYQRKQPILFQTFKQVERNINTTLQLMQRKKSLSQQISPIQLQNITLEEENTKRRDSISQKGPSQFSKKDVRRTLHPSLSQDCLNDFDKMYWVNGRIKQSQRILVQPEESELKTNQERTFYRSFYRRKVDSSYSIIQQTDSSIKIPTEPYKTQEEIERRYQRQQDKKIIGTMRFSTYLSKQHSQQSSMMYSTNESQFKKANGGTQNIYQQNQRNLSHQKWITLKKDIES